MSDTQVGIECLVHYNPQHIQVRKDFLDLCAYDKSLYNTGTRKSGKKKRDEPDQECMAKIVRLLETLTNNRKTLWQTHNEDRIARKRPPLKESAEYRIELAYSTIVRLLYNTHGESVVRNSIAALIQMGYIIRYQKNKASTPEYVLNIPLLQAHLDNQRQKWKEGKEEESEEEVLNVTPSGLDNFSDDDKTLNVTPEMVNVTPKLVHSTPEMVNVTPNNIESNTDYKTAHKTGSSTRSCDNHNDPSHDEKPDETRTPSQDEAKPNDTAHPTSEETRRETLNASLQPPKIKQTFPEGVSEHQKQIVIWYCEITKVPEIHLTRPALQCLTAITPDMETKEDVQGLYEQTVEDIAKRKDAPNKTVFFANQKGSLFNFRQKKQARQAQPATSDKPKANMTKDEAVELAQKATEDGSKHGYNIQARAISSKKVEGAWIVKVQWAEISSPLPTIFSLTEWDIFFDEMHQILLLDAKLEKEKVQHGKAQ